MGRRYRARTDYVRAIGSIAFPRGPSDSSPRPRAARAAAVRYASLTMIGRNPQA